MDMDCSFELRELDFGKFYCNHYMSRCSLLIPFLSPFSVGAQDTCGRFIMNVLGELGPGPH